MLLPSLLALSMIAVATYAAPQKRATVVECLTSAEVPQALPGTSNFTQGIRPFNLRIPFTPVALAIPSNVAQIQAAVKCGSTQGVMVSARSGGHSYANHGNGGEDGHLVIDLKYFNTVSVDNATNIATIGPGARLGNVALALFKQGQRAFSHGTCPGVGIGGHVLGGGYGYSSRTHGLALDALVEATVVLANGTLATASTTKNADLFWALRGAGASYGVVTSMKFQTFAAPAASIVFTYSYSFNQSTARVAFEALQEYANSLQSQHMNIRFFIKYFTTQLTGVYYGSRTDFDSEIQPLLSVLPKPTDTSIQTMDWLAALKSNAFAALETDLNYNSVSFYSIVCLSVANSKLSMKHSYVIMEENVQLYATNLRI